MHLSNSASKGPERRAGMWHIHADAHGGAEDTHFPYEPYE